MKLFISTLILLASFQLQAVDEPRTSCPKTRPCHQDRDCRIYAFKHNCHAQCRALRLQSEGKATELCSQQCLCLKKIKLTNA